MDDIADKISNLLSSADGVDKIKNMAEMLLGSTTTEKSADSALRNALKQILENPGGVILDYGDNEVSIQDIEKIVIRRLERQEKCTADILILNHGKIVRAIRYKK